MLILSPISVHYIRIYTQRNSITSHTNYIYSCIHCLSCPMSINTSYISDFVFVLSSFYRQYWSFIYKGDRSVWTKQHASEKLKSNIFNGIIILEIRFLKRLMYIISICIHCVLSFLSFFSIAIITRKHFFQVALYKNFKINGVDKTWLLIWVKAFYIRAI